MISSLFELLSALIGLYIWALILNAVVSTLAAFGALDTRNHVVRSVMDFLYRVTEPVLRPIRRVLPNFGNIDISPLIAILVLEVVQRNLLPKIALSLQAGSAGPLIY